MDFIKNKYMQNTINSNNILIQVAEKAQERGILSLEEAETVSKAVRILKSNNIQMEKEISESVEVPESKAKETINTKTK